jgi:hypothetical protein
VNYALQRWLWDWGEAAEAGLGGSAHAESDYAGGVRIVGTLSGSAHAAASATGTAPVPAPARPGGRVPRPAPRVPRPRPVVPRPAPIVGVLSGAAHAECRLSGFVGDDLEALWLLGLLGDDEFLLLEIDKEDRARARAA